ncbi:MAG TPA: hypothetical protein VHO07_21920 [Streptosporangiaceae bacterium]|jgi:hypothetical protein|nr:hypothetical protein [Streptosporangiaceae bacterium]
MQIRPNYDRAGALPPPRYYRGFDWAGTITPAAIAALLVVLLVFVRVTRAGRPYRSASS